MRLILLLVLAAIPVIDPQAQAQVAATDEGQEVVVTAQRAGAPVWRIRTATGTLVLVGSIDNVAAGTAWRPTALAETVGKADRVMFPQMVGISLSPFSMVGYYAKWKRRARLPDGQSLSGMMSKADFSRLARLAAQGLAPADFDRWHPLHLSFNMQDRLRKRTGLMEAPTATVARAASKFKVARVPIQRASARPLADTVFRSQPVEHLPCLVATIAAVEGGPEGLRQRSRDWAGKRVQAALAAPSQGMGNACWPANTNILDPSQLAGSARRSLETSGTTLAVVNLETLARAGGLLDTLRMDGRQVDGPIWR
jgi:hypothetical protein